MRNIDYSKLIILGNLTRDAEVKQAKDSEARYADFTVAVSRNKKKDETTFYPIRAFGKLGESFDTFEEFCNASPFYSFSEDDDDDNFEKIQSSYAAGCDKRNLEIRAIERHRRKTGAI